MRTLCCALTMSLTTSALSAATRIDEPKTFVTEVYRHYMSSTSYSAPEDIYTPRLARLFREDKKKSKGEVGCLDFDFWVNGQDFKLTNVVVTNGEEAPDRKTVIAKFNNLGAPKEIHFDFRREGGRWLLDDVHSMTREKWTLSEIFKCAP
jgi:hypothetical protein